MQPTSTTGSIKKDRSVTLITAVWMLLIGGLSLFPGQLVSGWTSSLSDLTVQMMDAVFALSESLSTQLNTLLPLLVRLAMYALLTLLAWLWLTPRCGKRQAYPVTLAVLAGFSGLLEAAQLLCTDRSAALTDWLYNLAAVAVTLVGIAACRWVWNKFPKLANRETVSYVIFGVLTTVVNIVVYGFCANFLLWNTLLSNAIAWLAGVLFAYVVNKLFVFQSHTPTLRLFMVEFGLFFAARLFSFLPDEGGMWLMVDVLAWNKTLSKVIANIVVVVLNYIFSKWIIFRKPKTEDDVTSAN